ncbi:MAG: flagellin FliC [Planctomycetes bacterium]|nr:flagellin FliC [Planctomycetota bacterium]
MGLFINTNVASINARGNLDVITNRLQSNYSRLSTGLRIVSASDDAAGLAISERMRAQIRSLSQAQRNANDGISLVQVGEGAMNELSNILIRMRELAIQASNGTNSAADKDTLDQEFDNLIEEVDRISRSTEFNGVNLLDGSTSSIEFQVGSDVVSGVDTIAVALQSVLASDLGIDTLDISSVGAPTTAIINIDVAIDQVAAARGDLGALQNRLQSTITNIGVSVENLSAAESRIRDVDVAAETAELTRNSILQQAAISILSQANVQPQVALSLLQQ